MGADEGGTPVSARGNVAKKGHSRRSQGELSHNTNYMEIMQGRIILASEKTV